MIRSRWRLKTHLWPFSNVTHQCQHSCGEVVYQHPYIPQGTSRLLYFNISTLFRYTSSILFPLDHLHLWKLLPYSKTEYSCLVRRGRSGIIYTLMPMRFCGNTLKRCITSLTQCSSQSLHLIPSPVQRKVSRWRRNQAKTQPYNNHKILTRQELS